MKTPSIDQLRLAADWCESNDGEEAKDLRPVIVWLRELAAKAELDSLIRQHAASAGIPRKELTPSTMNKIRARLVEKFGKPANAS